MKLSVIQKKMIESFQCPGCVLGMDTKCGSCEVEACDSNFYCKSHVAGTIVSGVGKIFLGLPKGFCRVGPVDSKITPNLIRLFESIDHANKMYNNFNVPVWALEQDNHLFVRCYLPRINQTWIDVIHGGEILKLTSTFNTIDAGEFYESMD